MSEVALYVEGIEVKGSATYTKGVPPERTAGDIGGWSLGSRRRLRQFLMRHQVPDGYKCFGADLTVPALPCGTPNPCVDQIEWEGIFKRFRMRCDRAGLCMVWRQEVQPRTETKRDDIRGIEQPHLHIIGGAPENLNLSEISKHWLECLGDRGKVYGAADRAANVSDCADWSSQRRRYLFDHASKAKLVQIAKGWGKHWGVTNRKTWVHDIPKIVGMNPRESVWFLRFLRRLTVRRVPDRRASGGISWSGSSSEPDFIPHIGKRQGVDFVFMGGTIFCEGWNGHGPVPLKVKQHICRCLGAAKKNVWSLKLGKCNRKAGQFFGVSAKIIQVAKRIAVECPGRTRDWDND